MNDLFDTIYYYTNNFYSIELDNYMYATVPGYLHVGMVMVITTCLACVFYYYIFKPIRKQNPWWFMTAIVNALINLGYALWYTLTPLINNEIEPSQEWTNLDCIFFGVTNILWSFAFFVLFSLLIKWWSPSKYAPFRKF